MSTAESKDMLPLGSVIKLKERRGKYIIIGRGVISTDKLFWDYALAEYPYGLLSSFQCIFSSADMVEHVIAQGYEDEQGKAAGDLIADMKEARISKEDFEQRMAEIREYDEPELSA